MKVRWLKRGLTSLSALEYFIAVENRGAARRVVDRIEKAVARLGQFPLMGRVGFVAGTRELIVPGSEYLVIYCVTEKEVQILRVFHCKQVLQ